MKTLFLDCCMGAAGDMLAAALTELLPERENFVAELNALGIPGVTYALEPSKKCGITGSHMTVTVHGQQEHSHDEYGHHHDHDHPHAHDHEHDHEHDHGHPAAHHHHGSLQEIAHIVSHLPVSDGVKENILAVYDLIARAESQVHGVDVTQIHFHEVGTLDAVADVTAVCLLMERLAPERVVVSPIHVGFGQVRCAHGILPVPAPATAVLLMGMPTAAGNIAGELCTPTGAALLKHFATEFGNQPPMTVSAIGYGMGQKDFPAANCLRAMLGET